MIAVAEPAVERPGSGPAATGAPATTAAPARTAWVLLGTGFAIGLVLGRLSRRSRIASAVAVAVGAVAGPYLRHVVGAAAGQTLAAILPRRA